MKHTPGPWTVGKHITLDGKYRIQANGLYIDIARAGTLDDARLIAAAPELLDIVKLFVGALNTNYSASTMNYEFGAAARQLLARIEGTE